MEGEESKEKNVQKSELVLPAYWPPRGLTRENTVKSCIAVGPVQVLGLACKILVLYWSMIHGGLTWSYDRKLQFSVHPLLIVLILIIVNSEAFLVYRVWHCCLSKCFLKLIHASLQLLAAVLSCVGLVSLLENHKTGMVDTLSLHGWFGMTTLVCFCLQFLSGFVTLFFPVLSSSERAKVLPFCTLFKYGIFLLTVAVAIVGLRECFLWMPIYTIEQYSEAFMVEDCLGVFLVAYAALVVYVSSRSCYSRRLFVADGVASSS